MADVLRDQSARLVGRSHIPSILDQLAPRQLRRCGGKAGRASTSYLRSCDLPDGQCGEVVLLVMLLASNRLASQVGVTTENTLGPTGAEIIEQDMGRGGR